MKKKRDAKWQANSLRLDEEKVKTRARVRIYGNENQDHEMAFKIEGYKQDNITYHQQTMKHSEINQHSDGKNVGIQNVYSSIPRENYEQKLHRAFDNHHKQIQLKLQLETQIKQLRITKWGRCCAS